MHPCSPITPISYYYSGSQDKENISQKLEDAQLLLNVSYTAEQQPLKEKPLLNRICQNPECKAVYTVKYITKRKLCNNCSNFTRNNANALPTAEQTKKRRTLKEKKLCKLCQETIPAKFKKSSQFCESCYDLMKKQNLQPV